MLGTLLEDSHPIGVHHWERKAERSPSVAAGDRVTAEGRTISILLAASHQELQVSFAAGELTALVVGAARQAGQVGGRQDYVYRNRCTWLFLFAEVEDAAARRRGLCGSVRVLGRQG
jgi:hypothetical protein